MSKKRPDPSELDELDQFARIAALETTNSHLASKVAELSFLSSAATKLGTTLDRDEIARIVVEYAGVAVDDRYRPRFFVIRSGKTVAIAGAAALDTDEAERIVAAHAGEYERCMRLGEAVDVGMHLVVPVPGDKHEAALGAIVVEGGHALFGRTAVRRLAKLAELGGRSLVNARLLAHSIAAGITDELTGLFNRRYFDRRLADELKRARRLGQRVSVLLFDLDRFKSINDRHGHPEGDRVLRAVAELIGATVRDIDVVTRWGGEEFAVIAPGSDGDDAVDIAHRVRLAMRALPLATVDGTPISLTISCGVAWAAADIHTPAQCVAAADRCLLAAKREGRDRVVAMVPQPAQHQGRGRGVDERTGREHRGAARRS